MKTLRDLPVEGRRVLVRADLNVPLDDGRIADDTRIRASVPTVAYLREHGADVVVCSHLGRPKGEVRPELSLRPVAERLSELLGEPVAFAAERGPVRLLENLRFDPREEQNDPALAEELAAQADLFVSDAFGTVHRAHASTVGVARLLPSAAGLLLAAELEAFERILEHPEHPFVVILGGAKVADKIGVIQRFTGLADAILIGGAMTFTFLAADGVDVGASKHEDADGQEVARRAAAEAGDRGCELVLPTDVVVAERVEADASTQVVAADAIPDGWMGLDIGPETAAAYGRRFGQARTIFWNGPMGVFELEPFAAGTLAVAHAVAESAAVSVVGGGDSLAAVNRAGVADLITHVSTGGGAALELVEGRTLPGVAALEEEAA
ncbi:MAG TPA: phosphoglycerate kinase [Gaiellales bacterium]|nr:phosphoglycerate kinase [Gaiellales bacterium]